MAQITDWLAQSYRALSKPLNSSRAVNCFAETGIQDAKSKAPVAVWGVPGTSPFTQLTEQNTLAAIMMNGIVYVVGAARLWQINADNTIVNLGAQGAAGQVSIDTNGVQIVWVDGATAWAYQPGGLAQQIVANANAGATSIVCAVTGVIQNGDVLNITLGNGDTFATSSTATVGPGTSVTIPLAGALPSAVSIGDTVTDPVLTLAQITDPNCYPSSTVTYFDGYFCFVRNGTKEFFLSPLFGIGPFDATLFASKEATADLLLAIANSHEQLFLFGQERTETWYDAGNAPPTFPFQRSDGALVQRGLAAVHSVVIEDNTVFFLGDDLMYYRLQGFEPVRISDHGVEAQWSTYSTVADCFGLTFTIFGHKMIVLTFPTARATWVLDLSTRRWHERESWLGQNADTSLGRWRVSWVLPAYNRILMGDSQSGQIVQLNENVYTEFGDLIPLTLIGPPFHTDRVRVFMRRFEVDMETGATTIVPDASAELIQYCPKAITMTKVATLTAAALATLPVSYATAVLSFWIDLAGATDTGMTFVNTGLSLKVQNNTTGTPQLALTLKDSGGGTIVAATYDFTVWSTWVNVLISVDTSSQQLQVWANTQVAGALVEDELTAVSLVWSSSLPVANPGGSSWQMAVV